MAVFTTPVVRAFNGPFPERREPGVDGTGEGLLRDHHSVHYLDVCLRNHTKIGKVV